MVHGLLLTTLTDINFPSFLRPNFMVMSLRGSHRTVRELSYVNIFMKWL